MEILRCKNCGSSLLNINAVIIKQDENVERNVLIKKEYLCIKDKGIKAIKHYCKCISCGKANELFLRNEDFFVSLEMRRAGDTTPKNQILAVEEGGGRFS